MPGMIATRYGIRRSAALWLGVLLSSTTAFAAIEQEAIEEIEVIGQRTLLTFRVEMYEAEEHMYALFNELNSEDKFDVTCEERVVINSHIQRHFCDRRYVVDARRQNVQDWMRGAALLKNDADLWTENEANHQQFSSELKAVAEQNPGMAAAIVDVVEKRKRYDEARRDRATNTFLGRLLTGQQD